METPPPTAKQGTWGDWLAPLYTRVTCKAGRLASSCEGQGPQSLCRCECVHCIDLVELSGKANFHQLLDREPLLLFVGGVLLGSVPVAMEVPGLVGVA